MLREPQFDSYSSESRSTDSYSTAERICVVIALAGIVMLAVVGINALYFLR